MVYHIARNGQQLGQFEVGTVQQQLASGQMLASDLCWTEGMADWQPLGQVVAMAAVPTMAPPVAAAPSLPTEVVNPYAAPAAALPMGAGTAGAPLASLGQRLGAAVVDGLVAGVAGVPIGIAMATAGVDENGQMGDPNGLLLGIGGLVMLGLLILNLAWLITRGQSVGKRVVGIRIAGLHSDANPGGVKTVLLRSFVNGLIASIPLLGAIYSLVDICFIFGEQRRCIHDLIAGTRVIQGQP